jgi:anti-sigma B factor antagonist
MTTQNEHDGLEGPVPSTSGHMLAYDRITIENASDIRQIILGAIRSQSDRVVVDMSEIAYMDTSGLATLLEALRQAHQQGKSMALRCIRDQPRYLFEVTELDHLFETDGKTNP